MESNTSSHAGPRVKTTGWSKQRWRLDGALAKAISVVHDVLVQLSVPDRLEMITKCRLILDTVESRAIAEEHASGTPSRKVEDLLHSAGGGKSSKRTVKKKARRGAVVNENPVLGNKMAAGELSDEQVDVIAEASDKTGGDAAHDTELIDKIAAAPPEQGKKIADKYVRDRQSQDDVDTAYSKARRARRVLRWTNEERGTDVLQIEGPAEDIDVIEANADQLADEFYRQDGGRDVASGDHRRTRDQRRFDAVAALMGGGHTHTDTDTADDSAGGSDTAAGGSTAGSAAGEPGTGRRRVKKDLKKPTIKTVMVIKASLEQAQGTDPTPVVLADGKPLPSTVVERLACGADFVGQIYGADGEILSQRRAVRSATFSQRIALISRHGGCVRCDAHYSRCVAHHLDPWTSRLKGETNVDRMALMCDDCHHHLHDNKLTLYQDNNGIWRVRKARPEEIAAPGPRIGSTITGSPKSEFVAGTPNIRRPRPKPVFTQRE